MNLRNKIGKLYEEWVSVDATEKEDLFQEEFSGNTDDVDAMAFYMGYLLGMEESKPEAHFLNITLDRFKNDCLSILKYKYGLSQEDAEAEVNALENEDYMYYIQDENSTEDYVDELVSCWGD